MAAVALVRAIEVVIPKRGSDRSLGLDLLGVLLLKIDLFALEGSDDSFGSRVAGRATDPAEPELQALDLNIVTRVFRRIRAAVVCDNDRLQRAGG